jgi:carotenoid cleavage dioxygenase-like enzyme
MMGMLTPTERGFLEDEMAESGAWTETGELTGPNVYNPYLQGLLFGPVAKETTALDLKVIGEIPSDLYGAYYRNGPNMVHPPQGMHHLFDGDAMLHSVYFENGKAEYRNRYIRTADFVANEAGTLEAGTIMSPPVQNRGERYFRDTAPTDVFLHNGTIMAANWRAGTPVRIGARTLETQGEESFSGKLPRFLAAHGKVDPDTGELFFFDFPLYDSWIAYGIVSAQNELVHFERIELPGPRLPHDFGITKNYVILHDMPLMLTEEGLRNKEWRITMADIPARFAVIPRRGRADQVRWFETDPCYIYHVVATWEEGDEVVMVANLSAANNHKRDPKYGPYAAMIVNCAINTVLVEWRMNMVTGACVKRQLDDRNTEFPVINLDYWGKQTRYGYLSQMAPEALMKQTGIHKFDLTNDTSTTHMYQPGWYGSEVAFAPRMNAKSEDDGYVISFVTEEGTGKSEALILDAQNIEAGPIGRVQIPARVPAGFHGTWARGDLMAR